MKGEREGEKGGAGGGSGRWRETRSGPRRGRERDKEWATERGRDGERQGIRERERSENETSCPTFLSWHAAMRTFCLSSSGWNLAQKKVLPRSFPKADMHLPLSVSHSLIVLSYETERNRRPSLENCSTTRETKAACNAETERITQCSTSVREGGVIEGRPSTRARGSERGGADQARQHEREGEWHGGANRAARMPRDVRCSECHTGMSSTPRDASNPVPVPLTWTPSMPTPTHPPHNMTLPNTNPAPSHSRARP